MIKIGITGSLASGKTTASNIISTHNGPLFSADKVVKKFYRNRHFKRLVSKKLKLKINSKFKELLKSNILQKKHTLKKLEKIIHPLVRKKMFNFLKRNKNKKILFLEIPLLVESKLMKYFDVILLIKSNKILRLKRYKAKKGDIRLFNLLDKQQLNANKKIKYCNHVIINNKTLAVFKKKLLNIIKKYE